MNNNGIYNIYITVRKCGAVGEIDGTNEWK